ncbi:MAG: hypothetical protein QXU47_04330 [Candidatus Bathyarchaeia archaeon]
MKAPGGLISSSVKALNIVCTLLRMSLRWAAGAFRRCLRDGS